jgi:hypothetical protein
LNLGSTNVDDAVEKNLDEVDDRRSGGGGSNGKYRDLLSMSITSYSFFSDTRFLSYTGRGGASGETMDINTDFGGSNDNPVNNNRLGKYSLMLLY